MRETPQLPPILQAFGRDLAAAMAAYSRQPERRRRLLVAPARPFRATLLAFAALLAVTTITLAATGVILTGAPVRPEELPNPNAGIGVSAPGGASGIVATAPDPEGGLPWGMRIVHTTRGETCLQIGRVQNGQLGVLGVDGAFANDGRFHPIPVNALPRDFYHNHVFDQMIGSATISCALDGKAVAGEHVGVDRSADPKAKVGHSPSGDLRDLLYGLLGGQAVSVTYHFERASHTVGVGETTGAYLIVHGFSPEEQAGSGAQALGTFGDLAPGPPLSLITYRIGGRVCNRGPSLPPWVISHLAKPCAFPHFPRSVPEPALHLPLQIRLETRGQTVSEFSISLIVPFTVTSAREHYTLMILSQPCGARGRGGSLQSFDRNVRRGDRIGWQVTKPSTSGCDRHTLNVEVVYSPGEGLGRTIASATIHAPPGTSFAAAPTPATLRVSRRRHSP
jgi:hypothetical protein